MFIGGLPGGYWRSAEVPLPPIPAEPEDSPGPSGLTAPEPYGTEAFGAEPGAGGTTTPEELFGWKAPDGGVEPLPPIPTEPVVSPGPTAGARPRPSRVDDFAARKFRAGAPARQAVIAAKLSGSCHSGAAPTRPGRGGSTVRSTGGDG